MGATSLLQTNVCMSLQLPVFSPLLSFSTWNEARVINMLMYIFIYRVPERGKFLYGTSLVSYVCPSVLSPDSIRGTGLTKLTQCHRCDVNICTSYSGGVGRGDLVPS